MMNEKLAHKIKSYLETIYEIPFEVERKSSFNDSWLNIKPYNYNEELFEIKLTLKNRLRMVAEVKPEKYAAFSIADMSAATLEKRIIFTRYAQQLLIRKAKVEFFINDTSCDMLDPGTWPEQWKNYRLRVTRSPICAEDEEFNELDIVSSWTVVIVGMFLSLLNITPKDDETHLEGGHKRIEINRYERNPVNRELCLIERGYLCSVCGFDFEDTYGEIGHHFIHVHHIVPISKIDETYMLNPAKDLIPVCPNCHAMIHRTDPPLLPDYLADVIRLKKQINKDTTAFQEEFL